MSDISGIGPSQPLRPLTGARPAVAKPAAEAASAPTGFGQDAADVRFPQGLPQAEAQAAPEAPTAQAEPKAKAEPRAYNANYDPATGTISFGLAEARPLTEEYDGFLVAGPGAGPTSLGGATGTPMTSGTGPIAMIEDPAPAAEVEFPGLDLNGPSTAHEGFFGLSGRRLA